MKRLWLAKVDFWFDDGSPDAQPEREQMSILFESEDSFTVARDATRIADANAPFGKRLRAIEFREAHTVSLPARVHMRAVNRKGDRT